MKLATIAATIIIGFFAGLNQAVPADAAGDSTHDRCNYEDGSGQRLCIWDAANMGNGEGNSFIALHGGTDRAKYIRITHARAYRLTH